MDLSNSKASNTSKFHFESLLRPRVPRLPAHAEKAPDSGGGDSCLSHTLPPGSPKTFCPGTKYMKARGWPCLISHHLHSLQATLMRVDFFSSSRLDLWKNRLIAEALPLPCVHHSAVSRFRAPAACPASRRALGLCSAQDKARPLCSRSAPSRAEDQHERGHPKWEESSNEK